MSGGGDCHCRTAAVWLAEKRRPAELMLQGTGVLQTIPSLALLGLLIPLVGIGSPPVLIALTLYALLPIFQNTLPLPAQRWPLC